MADKTQQVDLDEILAELSVFGGRVQRASGDLLSDVHFRVPSGSLLLDLALGTGCVHCSRGFKWEKDELRPLPPEEWKHPECRGWPGGRVCEIYGDPSSGKSTILGQALIECQRMGGISAVLDAERTLSKGRLFQMGADPKNLLVLQPDHMEQSLDMLRKVLSKLPENRQGPPVCIAFDTISCLLMEQELEGESVAQQAKPKYVRRVLAELNTLIANRNAVLLVANQTQEVPTKYGVKSETNIGGGLKFMASIRLETWASPGGFDEGGYYEGIATRIRVVKNKDARAHAKVTVPIYSETTPDGFPPGLDNWISILHFLSDKEFGIGLVKNTNGWWSCSAFAEAKGVQMRNARIRNRGELAEWLKTYPGLPEFLAEKVHEHRKVLWKTS